MGIIRAAINAVGGGLADQWLESIEANGMDNGTILTNGISVRRDDKRNTNTKGSEGLITDGSIIHVAENQFMLLVDGGKVIDYTAEPGYFTVSNGSAPSMFNGGFGDSLKETFSRVKYGGTNPTRQQVFFINMQEIRDIPFGTPSPINYFDNFYNAELYLRANGYYSIRVVNPLKFYAEMGSRAGQRITRADLQKSSLAEFLTAFQTAIAQMSVEGERISHVGAKSATVAKHMSTILDEEWTERRGMLIESVGINTIAYDESSKKLIDMRNQGAMLGDPTVREGYVQGAAARGMEAAGSNPAGATAAFMGMGMGMQQAGSFVAATSAANQAAMAQQAAAQPAAAPAPAQPAPAAPAPQAPAGAWACSCGQSATGNFCSACGSKKPEESHCPQCGAKVAPEANFCADCGNKLK